MGAQEAGVYWPFKNFLSGSGIVLTEDSTSIRIATTGAGPGGGDMLSSVYAPTGQPGTVDKAISAQTVTGVVAHATLADSIPWGGVTGKPTIFPTDWGSITNKPATMPPGPHATTHVTAGQDLIPLVTAALPGLSSPLSGKVTDFRAGDGNWRDLNTTVGSYALGMNAILNCAAGLGVWGGLTLVSGGMNIQAGGLTVVGNSNLGGATILQSLGNYCGIQTTTGNALWSWATGAAINKDCVVIYRSAGQDFLTEQYNDANGNAVWTGRLMNTSNPDNYTMRAGSQIAFSGNLAGASTAWASAPILISSSAVGGFCGIGFNSSSYWACALGAWQSGLWMATSSNTFIQLTDNSGHIVAAALGSGVAVANIGYAPVNRAGDTSITGDLWAINGTSTIRFVAYQDGQHYTQISPQGVFVAGDYNSQGGQIKVQATGGSQVAGITLISRGGYSFSIWGEDNGHLYAVRNNDGYTVTLL